MPDYRVLLSPSIGEWVDEITPRIAEELGQDTMGRKAIVNALLGALRGADQQIKAQGGKGLSFTLPLSLQMAAQTTNTVATPPLPTHHSSLDRPPTTDEQTYDHGLNPDDFF